MFLVDKHCHQGKPDTTENPDGLGPSGTGSRHLCSKLLQPAFGGGGGLIGDLWTLRLLGMLGVVLFSCVWGPAGRLRMSLARGCRFCSQQAVLE